MSYLCTATVNGHSVPVSDRMARLIINGRGRYDDKGHIYTADAVELLRHLEGARTPTPTTWVAP